MSILLMGRTRSKSDLNTYLGLSVSYAFGQQFAISLIYLLVLPQLVSTDCLVSNLPISSAAAHDAANAVAVSYSRPSAATTTLRERTKYNSHLVTWTDPGPASRRLVSRYDYLRISVVKYAKSAD